jgi:hypothetical protein
MRRKQEPEWTEFSIEIDGKIHKGSYSVESGAVTVRYGMAEQSTHVSGGPALSEARMLLRALVSGEASKPDELG